MKSTTNYKMFKFRDDNRTKLEPSHIKSLMSSIQDNNLLHLRPIICNKNMEIIDGQNRLKAAEALGVEIYYEVIDDITPLDMMRFNQAQKSWTMVDYFNFYCKNGYPEYLKLKNFIDNNNILFRVALNLVINNKDTGYKEFKSGNFFFNSKGTIKNFQDCLDIVNQIKQKYPVAKVIWLQSAKFWHALLDLVRHPDFDLEHFMNKLDYLGNRLGPKVTSDDYRIMITDIYNYRCSNRLELTLTKRV